MRHYDRAVFRNLNDGERYRDYDYRADDGWAGLLDREPGTRPVWREPPRTTPPRHPFLEAIRRFFLRAIGP